ncbi:MAG: ATP synthase F1 subunit gamma [Candidatus Tectomicrobia bacterium]|uniref:ATP synthase gamma chain n=1 Tax=Tectimicrobiota bacterium TaxID=2528274 RepID=A0A932GS77_UNCTE|nr:ATP synthase F1 subunit gamma [Candidatus Tectomicrobia bacterium]
MPSLRHIRRRISSVRSTQQITKAMKMVAAAKLRRAQDRMLSARPYAHKIADVVNSLALRVNRDRHPLLSLREGKRALVVVITADRGLCGAFNANVIKRTVAFLEEEPFSEKSLLIIGRKAADFFKRRTYPIRETHTDLFRNLTFAQASNIGKKLVEAYTQDTVDEIYLVYNEFKSVLQQRLTVQRLLPFVPQRDTRQAGHPPGGYPEEAIIDYLYEPSVDALLDHLLNKHVEVQVFQALLESAASEQGARMTAMEAATENAADMIQRLTLYFNKVRQASITKELIEVVSGAEALR